MEEKGIKRYSLSKQVADSLEAMIEKGDYEVGGKIPTEVELMTMFKVSRNTIREAVQSLVSAGVLSVKQGDGTYVRSNNRFNANMSRKYSEVSVSDILEARNALELAITFLAAERRTDEEMEKITKAFEARKGAMDTGSESVKADIMFHLAIAEASHNQILNALYKSICVYLEDAIETTNRNLNPFEIDSYHQELYLAILNKNSVAARRATQKLLNTNN